MTEKLPTFPKTQLVSLTLIKQLIDQKEIIHCQTLANSVEEAIENADLEEDEVPNSIEASQPTIFDRYKAAFSLDQFEINK